MSLSADTAQAPEADGFRVDVGVFDGPFDLLLSLISKHQLDITEVALGGTIELGPFSLELITLTHSIPEPNGLAIRTPLGTVLHTGDWKIDPEPLLGELTDEARLKAIGEEGALAMVCDSTNVFVEGEAGSEREVRDSLSALFARYTGRIAVGCFASNVARLDSIALLLPIGFNFDVFDACGGMWKFLPISEH